MISIDITDLVNKLENVVQYSEGFLVEMQLSRRKFNSDLGKYLVALLEEYIDAMARVAPDTLHHVYEWGQTGDKSARLFTFDVIATDSIIRLDGTFLTSNSIPPTGTEPFVDKARIMESGITVIIEPRDAEALVFEEDGETIFVTTSVTVEHPGGEAVAGSFEAAVESFLTTYVSKEILSPLFNKMARMKEYKMFFAEGARTGRRAGQRGAKRLMTLGNLDATI